MQQIAKMFASLGFNVDTSGLDVFKGKIREVRGDMALLARNARVVQDQFNAVSKAIQKVNDNLKIKKTDTKLSDTYDNLKVSVERVDKAFQSITRNQSSTTRSLGKIHGSIIFGEAKWKTYADQVQRTKDLLRGANEKMKELRSNASVTARVNLNQGGARVSGSSQRGSNSTTVLPMGMFGGRSGGSSSWLGGAAPFFRSFLPAASISGGLAATGYGLKEIVNRGREQQKMTNILKFSTNGLEDFNETLAFVKKTAIDLGVSSKDLGTAFAQINMSAGETLSKQQKQTMFTEMSSVFATMGASQDEQKLLFKAVNQMFSLGRIQAEEMNQLTGQGLVPRKAVYDAIKQVYGVKTNAEVQDLQKNNQLDPSKILPVLFKNLYQQAQSTGAFEQYKETSRFRQGQATEKFNQLSERIMSGGLDKALSFIFEMLMNIGDALDYVNTGLQGVWDGLKNFKQIVDDLTGGNAGLILTIVALIFPIFKLIRLLTPVVRLFMTLGRVTGGLSPMLTTLGSVIARSLLGRFLILLSRVTLVTSAIWLLIEAGNALKDSQMGKTTWLDSWFAQYDLWKEHLRGIRIELDSISARWSYMVGKKQPSQGNAIVDTFWYNKPESISNYKMNDYEKGLQKTIQNRQAPTEVQTTPPVDSYMNNQNFMKGISDVLGNMKGQVIINIDGRKHVADISYFGNAETISLMR